VTRGRLHAIVTFALLAVALTVPASAFPPYRSTDAGTADPWVFEARLGILRLRRDRGDTVHSSPLLRLNLGLPHAIELVTEMEVRPGNGGLTDAALGAKWVPLRGRWSLGTETLLLLPIPSGGGIGIESQLVVTYRDRAKRLRLHLNGGGFYDGRVEDAEKGWRASALAEFKSGRYRPGLEVFARKIGGARVEVLAGPGVIVDVGPVDIRLGVHIGLTAPAPDVVLDAWTSAAFTLK
jgi:hypothetical protein